MKNDVHNPKKAVSVLLLVFMSSLAPMSMDIYIPSLTIIMDYFSTGYDEVQLTLSLFLMGVSFFQLIFGPLSDKFGRRPILFCGLTIYLLATIACVFSTSIEMLNLARFFQGIGACGTGVTSFAVARDCFEGKHGAKVIASVTSAIGLVPVLAPMLGTYLQIWFGWHSSFVFLLLISTSIFIIAYWQLTETNQHQTAAPLHKVFKNYRQIISHRQYQIFSICSVLAFGALASFASNAPYYFIELGGTSIPYFSFLFAMNAAAFIAGGFITSRLTHKISLEILILIGGSLILIGGLAQSILIMALNYSVFSISIPMMICSFGIAMVMPTSMAGSIAPFRHIAGSASAMSGFIRFLGGSVLAALVASLQLTNIIALPVLLILCGLIIVIAINKQATMEEVPVTLMKE